MKRYNMIITVSPFRNKNTHDFRYFNITLEMVRYLRKCYLEKYSEAVVKILVTTTDENKILRPMCYKKGE